MGEVERIRMNKAYEARKAQRQADKEAYNKKQDNVKMQEDKAVERGVNKAKAKGRALKNKAKNALQPNHYNTKESSAEYRSKSLINHIGDELRIAANKAANGVKDAAFGAVRFGYRKVLKPTGNLIGKGVKFVTNVASSAKAKAKKLANAAATKAKGVADYIGTQFNKAVDWFKTAGRKISTLGD